MGPVQMAPKEIEAMGALGSNLNDRPRLCDAVNFDARAASPELVENVDGQTAAYIWQVQASFDSLRQSAAQLAGLLVLASIDKRGRILDPPILGCAINAQREVEDALRTMLVPQNAAHHYYHLSLAAERIGAALRIARERSLRSDDAALDQMVQMLRAGWEEMLSAARALPGFQVVDFGRSCCAVHRCRTPSLDAPANSVLFS